MKIKYDKADDIMTIRLSDAQIDYAEESNLIVVNFDKKKTPVSIEILDAKRFMEEQSKALPKDIKQSFFATA